MSKNEPVHPVVVATLNTLASGAFLRAERLRSKRNAMATISTGQQNRAIEAGKQLREAEAVANGWSQILTMMGQLAVVAEECGDSFARLVAAVNKPADETDA